MVYQRGMHNHKYHLGSPENPYPSHDLSISSGMESGLIFSSPNIPGNTSGLYDYFVFFKL